MTEPAYHELKLTPFLKRRLIEEAEVEGITLNEMTVRLLCKALALDPALGLVPSKPAGRPPKKPRLGKSSTNKKGE